MANTRAEIAARQAAIAAALGNHTTLKGLFNAGQLALTPVAADFQAPIIKLNEAAVAYNAAKPLMDAAAATWAAAVPSDPIGIPPPNPATPSPHGTHGSTVTDATLAVFTLSGTHPSYPTELKLLRNGIDTGGGGVELWYLGGVVYIRQASGAWFSLIAGTFAQVSDPRSAPGPTPSGDSLSARYTEAQLRTGLDANGLPIPGWIDYFEFTAAAASQKFFEYKPNQIVEETTLAAYGYSVPAIRIDNYTPHSEDPTGPAEGYFGPTLLSWRANINPPRRFVWLRYAIVPLSSISALDTNGVPVFTEGGTKLPGLESRQFTNAEPDGSTNPGKVFSQRSWHLKPRNTNPKAAPLWDQYPGLYWMKSYEWRPDASQELISSSQALIENKVNTVDVYVEVNDVGVPNGIRDMYVNDVRAMPDTFDGVNNRAVLWRAWEQTLIDTIDCVVFAGGTLGGTAKFEYLIGAMMLSTVRGGMMRTDAQQPQITPQPNPASWPDWRKNLPVGVPYEIPNSAGTQDGANRFAYSGLAWDDGPTSAVAWSAYHGGHGFIPWWSNPIHKFDFMQPAPKWAKVFDGVQGSYDMSTDTVTGNVERPSFNPNWATYTSGTGGTVSGPLVHKDGSLNAIHAYATQHYNRARGWVVNTNCHNQGPEASAQAGSSAFHIADSTHHVYNVSAPLAPFDPANQMAFVNIFLMDNGQSTGFNGTLECAKKHPVTEDIWIAYGMNRQVWKSATNTVITLPRSTQNSWAFGPMLIDTKRNVKVFPTTYAALGPSLVLQFESLSETAYEPGAWIPVTGPTAIPAAKVGRGACFVYDPDRDLYVFIIRDSDDPAGTGYAMYNIDPVTFVMTLVQKWTSAHSNEGGPLTRTSHLPAINGVAFARSYGDNMIFIPSV